MRAKEKLTELFMLRLNPVDKRGLKLTRNASACLWLSLRGCRYGRAAQLFGGNCPLPE